MRLFFILCTLFVASAHCRPGVFDWISSSKNTANSLIDSTSTGIWETLGRGNAIVQLGAKYASLGVDKAANFTKDVVHTSANIGSNMVSGSANAAKSVLGGVSNAADYVDSYMNIPLASSVIKPMTNFGDRVVGGMESIGQSGINIGESIANANVGFGQTLAQMKIKGIGTLAAAGTLGGQVGTAAAASIQKTLVDNIANMTSQGLSHIISRPDNTEVAPLHTGTGFLVNQNAYDAVDQVTPYLIEAATKFWDSFRT